MSTRYDAETDDVRQAALRMAGAPPSVSARSGLARWYFENERAILGTAAVVLVLTLWELSGSRKWIDPLFTSSPSRILRAARDLFASGEIWNDLRVSGIEFALGYLLAIATAIPLGIACGWYPRVSHVLDPFLSALYATPRVALFPLVLIWFGIGIWSKVVLVYLGALFPILINTVTGVRTSDPRLLKAGRSFGATDLQLFRTVVVPGSIPFIISGLRLGVGRALVGIVVGEMAAATAGIGFLITVAGSSFQTDKVMVGVLIIAAAGMVSMDLLGSLERRFDRWRPAVNP
jgi:NitT/TauT family transport system permease protein